MDYAPGTRRLLRWRMTFLDGLALILCLACTAGFIARRTRVQDADAPSSLPPVSRQDAQIVILKAAAAARRELAGQQHTPNRWPVGTRARILWESEYHRVLLKASMAGTPRGPEGQPAASQFDDRDKVWKNVPADSGRVR